MASVQDPKTGQWYPISAYNNFPAGNVMLDDGTLVSHEMYQPPQAPPPVDSGGGERDQGGITNGTLPIGSGQDNWNGGSPPAIPLQSGMGWEYNGSDWVQVPGRGLGYTAPAVPSGGGNLNQGADTPYQPSGGGGGGEVVSGGGGSSQGQGQGQGTIAYDEPGDLPVFDAPKWEKPPDFVYDKKFAAPDEAALKADPSFQFRLDQGRKALEQSAAGRGLLRSGGTLKDLVDYGQNFATQEYANVYNRGFNEYKFDYDKEADIYQTNYGVAKDVFDRNYKSAYDEYQPKLTGWQTKTNNKARAQEAIFNRDWQSYIADQDRELRRRQIEQGDWS